MFLNLEKMLSLFTVEYDVSCRSVLYGLYNVCSLYAHILENFYHKCLVNFVKAFSASIEMIIFFFLQLVDVFYHTDLQILKNPCIPDVNPLDQGV